MHFILGALTVKLISLYVQSTFIFVCLFDFILYAPINNFQLYRDVLIWVELVQIARRLRAKFWPDRAIPDTSMKFGTVVGHARLSRIGYRTTLGNAYCACAKHFLIFVCYHRAFIQFDFKEGVML